MGLPRGRDLGALNASRCKALLRRHKVAFEEIASSEAESVEQPIRLTGPVDGIPIQHRNHGHPRRGDRIARLEILDCRLAIALLDWSRILHEAGVRRVEHYSMYRAGARVGGTGKPSGHATGLAIDVGELVLSDASRVVVDADWKDKRRGGSPCPPREGESASPALLRRIVCTAAEQKLFQILLTPHHDEHHANHLHLEVRPDVDWQVLE